MIFHSEKIRFDSSDKSEAIMKYSKIEYLSVEAETNTTLFFQID